MDIVKGTLLLCIMLVVIHPGLLTAQTDEIHALIEKADKSRGKEQVDAISELSKKFYNIDPERGIAYGKRALHLADSLRLPSLKSRAWVNIGTNYWGASEFDSARIYFDSAFRNASLFKDSNEIALIYNRKGLIYEAEGKFDSSMYIFLKEMDLLKRLNNPERLGNSLENIGTIYLHRGEYKSAITFLLEAKGVFEKHKLERRLSYIYLKLGQIYSESNEYSQARKYFQLGVDLALKNNEMGQAGAGLNALGILYKKQEIYDSALMKYQEALGVLKSMPKSTIPAQIYNNIGNIYLARKDFAGALQYHQKSLEHATQLKMKLQAARAQVGIGQDYEGLKKERMALVSYEEALPVFLRSKTSYEAKQTYEALIRVNKTLNNYRSAVYYYDALTRLKDSLNTYELNTALDSLRVKFHTEQTETENNTLLQQSDLQKRTIRFQQITLISAGIAVVSLVILILAVYRGRRRMQMINKKLTDLSAFKDSMTRFLVHDLKNALNAVVNFDARSDPEQQLMGVKHSGRRMLALIHNLLDIGKFESNRIELKITDVVLSPVIKNAVQQLYIPAASRQIIIRTDTEHDFMVHAEEEITGRILFNLLDNAIKHSPANGEIEVLTSSEAGMVRITVRDHGEGIPAEFLPLIFEKYSTGQNQPQGNGRSYGLGLAFCKMAVEAQGGQIGIESQPGMGTTAWFTLPIAGVVTKEEIPEKDVTPEEKTGNYGLGTMELAYLQSACAGLQELTIHQISDIKDILNQLDVKAWPGILRWKSDLEHAMYNCNVLQFQQLINSIKQPHE